MSTQKELDDMASFTKQKTECGSVYAYNGRANAHILDDPIFATLLITMDNGINDFESIAATYQPEAAVPALRRRADPIIRDVGRTIGDVSKARTEANAATARMQEIPKSVRTDRHPEIRNLYRGADVSAQMTRVQSANLEELSALTGGGADLAGLHDAVRPIAERRFLSLAHLERTGMAAQFGRAPSLDNLTGSGVDHAAAEAASAALLDEHFARFENLADIERSLRSVIDFVAVATDQQPDAVLADALAK